MSVLPDSTLTAFSTAVIGLSEGWRRGSIQPVWRIGVPAVLGLFGLLAYNRFMFGEISISGGYTAVFTERIGSQPTVNHLGNFVGFFVSANNGIFVWSPVVLLASLGLVLAWKAVPDWARSSAIAALAYIVVLARLNRVSGGAPFGYRYPLEALMLAAPALTLGARALWDRNVLGRRLVATTALFSILLQVLLVFVLECEDAGTGLATCWFLDID